MNGTVATSRQRALLRAAPALVLAAHGTRDGRDRPTVEAIAQRVRSLRPTLPVRTAYLQFSSPDVTSALEDVHGDAVVVPLLLSTGYHLRVDLPEAIAAARALQPEATFALAASLGPHPLLVEALTARLHTAGWRPGVPVVLAAAGSTDPAASADVEASARALGVALGVPVRPGYAAGTQPTVADTVTALRAEGAQRVAVASYLISPGQFSDVARAAGADVIAAPVADHLAVGKLVLLRYDDVVPPA